MSIKIIIIFIQGQPLVQLPEADEYTFSENEGAEGHTQAREEVLPCQLQRVNPEKAVVEDKKEGQKAALFPEILLLNGPVMDKNFYEEIPDDRHTEEKQGYVQKQVRQKVIKKITGVRKEKKKYIDCQRMDRNRIDRLHPQNKNMLSQVLTDEQYIQEKIREPADADQYFKGYPVESDQAGLRKNCQNGDFAQRYDGISRFQAFFLHRLQYFLKREIAKIYRRQHRQYERKRTNEYICHKNKSFPARFKIVYIISYSCNYNKLYDKINESLP